MTTAAERVLLPSQSDIFEVTGTFLKASRKIRSTDTICGIEQNFAIVQQLTFPAFGVEDIS